MYVVEPGQRTLSTFAEITGELKERLHRWTQDGQYEFLFDDADYTLTFSRFRHSTSAPAVMHLEVERMKEKRFDGTRSGRNFTHDHQTDPLVYGIGRFHARRATF